MDRSASGVNGFVDVDSDSGERDTITGIPVLICVGKCYE